MANSHRSATSLYREQSRIPRAFAMAIDGVGGRVRLPAVRQNRTTTRNRPMRLAISRSLRRSGRTSVSTQSPDRSFTRRSRRAASSISTTTTPQAYWRRSPVRCRGCSCPRANKSAKASLWRMSIPPISPRPLALIARRLLPPGPLAGWPISTRTSCSTRAFRSAKKSRRNPMRPAPSPTEMPRCRRSFRSMSTRGRSKASRTGGLSRGPRAQSARRSRAPWWRNSSRPASFWRPGPRHASPSPIFRASGSWHRFSAPMSTRFRSGDSAEVETGISKNLAGKVDNVSAEVDPNTRSVAVRVIVENPGDLLKKQMYVRVLIRSRPKSSGLLVPVSAVLRDDENLPFVYVARSRRQFRAAARHHPFSHRRSIRHPAGLKPGNRIVVDGGIFIQFMQSQ